MHQAQIVVTDGAVELGFDLRLFEPGSGGATDMEGTHGELGAGLADGLRGDNADGFAQLDLGAGGQVAAIAFDAHALFALAGEHRADFHLLDP